MALLRCIGVSKAYNGSAGAPPLLQALDLSLDSGQSVAILGPSGSGKTTLLNLVAGLEPADGGQIWLSDHPLHQYREAQRTRLRRQHLGMVFQFFNLIPTLTVAENMLLPLQLSGRLEWAAEVDGYLERLGLTALRDSYPEQLSGGEQQRIAIARALIHRPWLVLADEPTGSLDNRTAEPIMALMFEQLRERGQSLILVTHNEQLAGRADRCLRLRCGRLSETSPP